MVLCRRCHSALHKGLKLCPVCKKKYAPNEADCCFSCYCDAFPEVKERVELAKVQRKKKQRELRKKRYNEAKTAKKLIKKQQKEKYKNKKIIIKPDKFINGGTN